MFIAFEFYFIYLFIYLFSCYIMWQVSAKGLVMFTDQTSISLNWQNIVFVWWLKTGWRDRWMDGLVTNADLKNSFFSNDFKAEDTFSKVGLKPLNSYSWCNVLEVCRGYKTRSGLFFTGVLVVEIKSNMFNTVAINRLVFSLTNCLHMWEVSLLKGFLKSCQALLVYGRH